MNTPEYLDAVKRRLTLPSDYALQKPLGISKAQVSAYRTGKETMSDSIALRVAEILDMPAGRVLVDVHMERSKTPEMRAAWAGILEKISAGFDALLSGASPRRIRLPAC
jgi:hypothetical protein